MTAQSSRNVRLLAHHPSTGFGNCAGHGHPAHPRWPRILWIATESAPRTSRPSTSPIPRAGAITQTDLLTTGLAPLAGSGSATCSGGVPDECARLTPAGFEIFDVADPAKPRSVSASSTPRARRVGCITCGGWTASSHCSSGGRLHAAHRATISSTASRRAPAVAAVRSAAGGCGTREGDAEHRCPGIPRSTRAIAPHNTNVYPQRPTEPISAISTGAPSSSHLGQNASEDGEPLGLPSAFPRLLPHRGAAFRARLLVVSDEATKEPARTGRTSVWIVDAHTDGKLVPISTCPLPPSRSSPSAAGRFGAQQPARERSRMWVLGALRRGDVLQWWRARSTSADPFIPARRPGSCRSGTRKSPTKPSRSTTMIDERGITYAVDRMIGRALCPGDQL